MRRFVAVSVVAATVCGSGCSSDASGSETTTPPSVTTTPATSPPVSASPDTTAATTSTSVEPTSTTSTTTTTAAPPTTDPTTALAAELQQTLEDGEAAIFEVFADPATEDGELLLSQYFTGDALDNLLSTLGDLRNDGLRARPNPEVPQVVLVQSVPRLLGGGERASAAVCRVDAGVIFKPSGDDAEVVVNSTIRRTTAISDFVRVDGRWKLAGGETTSSIVGATTCDE